MTREEFNKRYKGVATMNENGSIELDPEFIKREEELARQRSNMNDRPVSWWYDDYNHKWVPDWGYQGGQ